MTTAPFVSITCRACGLTSTVPVDALLVSVAAETSADTAENADDAGAVAWTCEGCADLTTARLDWPALLTLVRPGHDRRLRESVTSPSAAPSPRARQAAGAAGTRSFGRGDPRPSRPR